MTQDIMRRIDRQIEDSMDDLHDLFVLFHEQGIHLEPSEYIRYIYPRIKQKVLEISQDLTDEFDEEIEE